MGVAHGTSNGIPHGIPNWIPHGIFYWISPWVTHHISHAHAVVSGSRSHAAQHPCPQPAMLSKSKRPYDPEELAPRTRLRRNFQDLVGRNVLSTARTVELTRDINRVDPASFADTSRLKPTKNYARDFRRKFLKSSVWMPVYWAQARCVDVKTQVEGWEWVAIHVPHEIVHVLDKQSAKAKLMEVQGMDPLTRQHHSACEEEAHCKLLGLGMWADGAPCNWDRTETVDTMSVSLPGLTGDAKNLRIPMVAISHKHVGQHTWADINAVIKWSLDILATGHWPTCRHDGAPWRKSDCKRQTGPSIQRACLAEVRADWDWMAKVYGFPQHNVKDGCCWKCWCTPAEVLGAPSFNKNKYIYIYICIYLFSLFKASWRGGLISR